MTDPEQKYLTVWGDTVVGRDLLIALLATTALSLGGFILAPGDDPMPLVFGIGGALIGAIGSALVFPPKRHLDIEGED